MKISILTDKSRLQEIYDLRVIAWEHSDNTLYINKQFFPDGWQDKFDEIAYHWIVTKKDEIIASARIVILNSFDELEEDLSTIGLEKRYPVAFFSRLVVHPKFRGNGINKLLDKKRIDFVKSSKIPQTIAFANKERIPKLLTYGFKVMGIVSHYYGSNPKIDRSIVLILNSYEPN